MSAEKLLQYKNNNQQTQLELYIQLLHTNCRGLVCLSQKSKNDYWLPELFVPANKVNSIITKRNNINDQYISVNEFNRNCSRKEENITQLRSLFIDIDIKHNNNDNILNDSEAFIVLEDIEQSLASINCPQPTLIINSGRGLQMYWSFNPVPKSYLPTYKQAQQLIYNALKDHGADPAALDASRVLRLPGTINTKSGTQAAVIGGSQYVFDFFELAEELNISTKPQNARKSIYYRNGKPWVSKQTNNSLGGVVSNLTLKKVTKNRSGKANNTTTALHEARLKDYIRLIEGRYSGGQVEAGKQDLFLFLMSVSLANIHSVETLREAALEINNKYIGFNDKDVLRVLSTLFSLVEQNKVYKYKSSKLVQLLEITEDEINTYNLRTLITHKIRLERRSVRRAKHSQEELLERKHITTLCNQIGWSRRRIKKMLDMGFDFSPYLTA